jgi:hypothetical protein
MATAVIATPPTMGAIMVCATLEVPVASEERQHGKGRQGHQHDDRQGAELGEPGEQRKDRILLRNDEDDDHDKGQG